MKRGNAALLSTITSQGRAKKLIEKTKKSAQSMSCNDVDGCALIVSAVKSKIGGSLYLILGPDEDIDGLEAVCLSLLDCSVYKIKRGFNKKEDVPGFVSSQSRALERGCDAILKNKAGLYIIEKPSLSIVIDSTAKATKEVVLSVGEAFEQSNMINKLDRWGYVRSDHCRGDGTYSVRGGIVDVFPKQFAHPMRIEFLNNTVESIRLFDVDTQLSVSNRKRINIPKPINFIASGDGKNIGDIIMKSGHLLYITMGLEAESVECDFAFFSERLHELEVANKKFDFDQLLKRFKHVFVSNIADEPISLPGGATSVETLFLDSFSIPSLGLACLAQPSSNKRKKDTRLRLPANVNSKKVSGLSDLLWGDLLVHQDYGIGKYCGLEQIVTNNKKEENIKIEYSGGSFVYVPIDRFERVHKYIGQGRAAPALSSLGTAAWQKQKLQTKKSTERVVSSLIRLYASRSLPRGFDYSPDGEIFSLLVNSFPHKETKDQSLAIDDVLNDLKKPHPMDRLLYGDVGFGKTEVALRAIVAVVTSGRSCFFLAPTTVLSDQHYITCKSRLGPLGINVELLSRFRTKKEQSSILKNLKEKKIDVIVGTHRLLSEDVYAGNLGLLIVDEEHRFGVKNKEKIKTLKSGVDVLTLTATPIPRTLQQSLVGLKDTSKIETPPKSRLPIKTYVKRFGWSTVEKIIKRELNRGGQVYFVHNDILGLSFYRDRLSSLFPRHSVGLAHSKVSSRELEKTVLGFFKGTVSVLVCTSIIESGLDIPNANTIIINEAQNFGLSQLYQIRGRVGRGSRQARCYLCIPKDHKLSPTAFERLKSIEFNTSLGSGYTVAMKDLEIRGSGNLFGLEQSGQVARVGLSLYNKILTESVQESQGKQGGGPDFPAVLYDGDAFFEEAYMPLVEDRLYYYQTLSEAENPGNLLTVKKEIVDRFGLLPCSANNLFIVSEVRLSFSFLFPKKININKNFVSFYFDSLPTGGGASSFARAVEHLSLRSGFEVKTKTERGGSVSVSFSGASINDSVDISVLFDSLFSKQMSK